MKLFKKTIKILFAIIYQVRYCFKVNKLNPAYQIYRKLYNLSLPLSSVRNVWKLLKNYLMRNKISNQMIIILNNYFKLMIM